MKHVAVCCLLVLVFTIEGCSGQKSGGSVVFQSSRDGNFEIYTMRLDGTHQQRITDSPTNDISPSWSPDGSTILFASDRDGNWEIYTVRSDGSSPTPLTHGEGSNTAPSWASKGTKIVFISSRDAIHGEVYIMDKDGGNVERITRDSLVKDTPLMTPDGTTLLVTINTRGKYAIAAIAVQQRTLSVLTPMDHNSMQPALSTDGSEVLFATDRDGNFEIYSMTTTGTHQTRLTSNEADDFTPAWTGDRKKILLSRKGNLYMVSLEERTESMLSYKGDSAPHWTPQ